MREYLCPTCETVVAPAEAREAHYHCPACDRAYLVARMATPVRATIIPRPAEWDFCEPERTSPEEVAKPKDAPTNEKDAVAMEQLVGTLAQLAAPVSLEIAGEQGRRQLLIRGAPEVVEHVAAQLYAVYGQVEIAPLSPDADPAWMISAAGEQASFGGLRTKFAGAQLTLAGPEFLPIKTWREFEGNDPLVAILGAFDGLQPGERALSQVVIQESAPAGWADEHLEQLARLRRRGFGGDAPMPSGSIARGIFVFVAWLLGLGVVMWALTKPTRWLVAIPIIATIALISWFLSRFRNRWAGAMEDEATTKLREQAFCVEIRLFAQAETEARAAAILNRLISTYRLFNTTSGNRFQVSELPPDATPLRFGVNERSRITEVFAPQSRPALLNVCELAGMWHMPVGEALELVECQTWERHVPLPETVASARGAYRGESAKGSDRVAVRLSPAALDRNIFIIGKTQHGKSTIMEHVAAHWMRDPERAVLVVDPHGDLARRVIGLVPPERVPDVIYVDLAEATRSVALNLLDGEELADPDDIAESFVDVGKPLWQKYWGPRMIVPLGYALRALAIANLRRQPEQQFTILALSTLLTCKNDVRQAFLEREVPRDDLAGFIGSLFLNVMRGVITRQTALPREQRVRVSVIADEFQIMAGANFGAMLGELQKNGGNFVLGTQSLDNLRTIDEDGALAGKVFAGVTTTIALQTGGADARYLVETELDFKRLSPESLTNLPPYHAYVKTIDANGRRLPAFSLAVAPPLQPDQNVVAAVQAGRQAYTAPVDVAERLVRESMRRFELEYALVSNPDYEGEYGKGPGDGGPPPATQLRGRDAAPRAGVPLGAQPNRPHPAHRARMIAAAREHSVDAARPRATPPITVQPPMDDGRQTVVHRPSAIGTGDPDAAFDDALRKLTSSASCPSPGPRGGARTG